ncbi:SEC-C domain-containing protein [Actinomycetospora soli]|uniref:SEC-C domain-containing protein n=1 Tax=Actinomycetospora soli TaxID=2893887 RepID=UPI001E3BB27F|nr:SEC-C domain-containing protein [Actinomycetospora soli]MCD2186658.1 SEC-C domain-containing protein [Actinomycetospora soli]
MAAALTEDDLTGISSDAISSDDPRPFIDQLVAAVDEDRLAEPDLASYALGLAADLADGLHDGELALTLSERSLEATRGLDDEHWTRARHAELLLRFGREDEGMRELHALRPQLTRDEMASLYVTEALTENGRAELAEEWLTSALTTAADIVERAGTGREADEVRAVENALAVKRFHVRRDLGLPHDEIDRIAEQLDEENPDHVFWPEKAHATLLEAQPDAAEELGATWDEHRAIIERDLQASDPTDLPYVEIGTPDLLTALLGDDEDAVPPPGPELEWPPGRNDPCWCGSGAKYKKCCLPRGRA